jgi:D-arabinose 1-dehydrogenase-like Zn-dependent alcohol dehydrogenase
VQHEWAELAINGIYGQPEDTQAIRRYCERHGVNSMLVLTIDTYYTALKEAEAIWPRIEGRTVVEIGAGVGMLALQMAKAARRVFAIEADPSWAWVFTEHLYALKPANLTYIFGAAAEVAGLLHADVAVVYTRSDVPQMLALAGQFAPEVIKGPLVGFADRHGITEEHEAFLERVIARLPKNSRTARGFSVYLQK